MTRHLDREINNLKNKLLSLCTIVEESVFKAVDAVKKGDVALAKEVAEGDSVINTKEVEVEEDCLKILALYQPVALDLRLVVAALKMNNDLERIGDLATNIAFRSIALSSQPLGNIPFDLNEMSELTRRMLRMSLDSLIQMNADTAREVCSSDKEVDEIYRTTYKKVNEGILRDLSQADKLLNLLSVSRNLERIADLATNIAEDVIYMIEGDIVRHQEHDFC